MIVICAKCQTQFIAKAEQFLPNGKKVRCANCKHIWFQHPSQGQQEISAPKGLPSPKGQKSLGEQVQRISELKQTVRQNNRRRQEQERQMHTERRAMLPDLRVNSEGSSNNQLIIRPAVPQDVPPSEASISRFPAQNSHEGHINMSGFDASDMEASKQTTSRISKKLSVHKAAIFAILVLCGCSSMIAYQGQQSIRTQFPDAAPYVMAYVEQIDRGAQILMPIKERLLGGIGYVKARLGLTKLTLLQAKYELQNHVNGETKIRVAVTFENETQTDLSVPVFLEFALTASEEQAIPPLVSLLRQSETEAVVEQKIIANTQKIALYETVIPTHTAAFYDENSTLSIKLP